MVVNTVLVSPLVKPVVKIKLSIKLGSFRLVGHSLGDFLVAATFDIAATAIFFLFAPVTRTRSRLLTHASPAVCSMFVTLFNKLTNIITLSAGRGKGIVPNITVTATLVPPLYATKCKLTSNGLVCFLKTFCLCFVGSIFVDLTAFVKMQIVRFRQGRFMSGGHRGAMHGCVVLVIILAVYPTICLAFNVVGDAFCRATTGRFVGARLGFRGARILSGGVDCRRQRVHIILVNPRIPRTSVTLTHDGVGRCGLRRAGLIILRNVGGSTVSVSSVHTVIVRSFCGGDRRQLRRRRGGVSSLRGGLRGCGSCSRVDHAVVPRLGMLCPSIAAISVSRALRAAISSLGASAVTLTMLGFAHRPDRDRGEGVAR